MDRSVRVDDQPPAGSAPLFRGQPLPAAVATLFWDYPDRPVELSAHLDLLISRVLGVGAWPAVRWLRAEIGDQPIRSWLERTEGRRLDRRGLRLWQVLLELPPRQVESWLADPRRRIWDNRSAGASA